MVMLRRNVLLAGLALPFGVEVFAESPKDDKPNSERLVIAYNDDFAPYSYVEEGHLKGILPEALKLILSSAPNLALEQTGLPWERVQLEVKRGQADAFCTFASTERQQYILFHEIPVVTLRPSFFFSADSSVRKYIEKMSSRDELMKLRLIDLKGNQWAEQNLKSYPNVEFAPTFDSVFRMIMGDRADVHVSLSPAVTKWRLRKLGLSSKQIISIPAPFVAAQVPFHLLVSKQYPRAREILSYVDTQLRKPAITRQVEGIEARYE